MNYEEVEEKVFAEQWATLSNGRIVNLGEGYPPQEILSCQIKLTRQEHMILKVIDGRLEEAAEIIREIQAKIKANGS